MCTLTSSVVFSSSRIARKLCPPYCVRITSRFARHKEHACQHEIRVSTRQPCMRQPAPRPGRQRRRVAEADMRAESQGGRAGKAERFGKGGGRRWWRWGGRPCRVVGGQIGMTDLDESGNDNFE